MKEETLEEASDRAYSCGLFSTKTAFIAGVKWQQERSYSEEDMKKAFNAGEENVNNCYTYMPFEEWFKQFKNK